MKNFTLKTSYFYVCLDETYQKTARVRHKIKNSIGGILILFFFYSFFNYANAQTRVFATQAASFNSAPSSTANVTDSNLNTSVDVRADAGVAVGLFGSSGYVEFTFTGSNATLPANTTSYIKVTDPNQKGILSAVVGGSIGGLLSDVVGAVLGGNQIIEITAKNNAATPIWNVNANVVLNEESTNFTNKVQVVVDGNNNYYFKITPDQPYSKIRITHKLQALVGGLNQMALKVYDAFYYSSQGSPSSDCQLADYTSFNGSGITAALLSNGNVVNNPHFAIDNNLNNYSSFNFSVLSAGVAPALEQTVYFDKRSNPGDIFMVRLQKAPDILAIDILSGIQVVAYNGTEVIDSKGLSSLLSVDLLGLFNNGEITTIPITTPAGKSIDRITLRYTGLIGLSVPQELRFYGVSKGNLSVSLSPGNLIAVCEGTAAATTAIVVGCGPYTYSWSDETTVIGTNETITFPAATSGTKEYYLKVTDQFGASVSHTISVVANTTTWDGTIWSNGLPNATTAIVIEGNYNTDTDLFGCTLTVNNNAEVIIPAGRNVTLNGFINVQSGSFTLENNANLVQITDAVNTGNIIVSKQSSLVHYLDYTLWSSPVTGLQTVKEFSPGTLNERFYIYNTLLSAYSNFKSLSQQGPSGFNPTISTFVNAKGYLIRMPDGLSQTEPTRFTGQFIGVPNNGDINIALSTEGERYSAIGNPYPSPINIYNFIDVNEGNIEDGTLYFWRKRNDQNTSSYATITKLAYTANEAEGGDTGSGTFNDDTPKEQWVINSGQGFFIKATPTATAMSFNNSMRRAVNNNQFFRGGNSTESVFKLNITGSNGAFSQTAIGYTEEATIGLDYGWDGRLLDETKTALYTKVDNAKLSIQARPKFNISDVVALNYKVETAETFKVSLVYTEGIFAEGQDIYLKDKLTNTIHNLKSGDYSFVTEGGTFDGRFDIIYTTNTLGIAEQELDSNSVTIYQNEGTLHINSGNVIIHDVKVYDVSGRMVYNKSDINSASTVINNLKVQQQILIVQVTTGDNTKVSKKIIY